MTENELLAEIRKACKQLGLLHYHTRRSEGSERGFPDSVIVGTSILFRELKSDSRDARITGEQRAWGARIQRAGGNWDIWYPNAWRNGFIQHELASISPLTAIPARPATGG